MILRLIVLSALLVTCLTAAPESIFTRITHRIGNLFGLRTDYNDPNIVSTKSGAVRGQVLTSRGGQQYRAFVGIPYAEKTRRFEVALPVKHWEGVRDALNYSSVCPQTDPTTGDSKVFGDEDCLYLNVYYPVEQRCQDQGAKLPILFHIHGEGFRSGSGELYDPKYFMDECIVYVSINYRLGVLGFLTTNDGVIPGNLGLKDSLLALKWTSANIKHFRGDKGSITLTGIGAGGMMVSHFLASSAPAGLFHRVIAQSGSSVSPFIIRDPSKWASRLGQLVNCKDSSPAVLKGCLSSVSVQDLVSKQLEVKEWKFDFFRFAPVVEPDDVEDPFQTEHPYTKLKRGHGSQVPLITGTVKDEGVLLNANPILADPATLADINARWSHYAPLLYLYNDLNLTARAKDSISEKIKSFYLKGRPVGRESAQGFTDSQSDRYFNYGSWEEACLHSKYAHVYHYMLTFKGNYSLTSALLRLPTVVVSHGHDAAFLYKTLEVPEPEPRSDRLIFSQHLIKLWVSFIKDGTPTAVWPDASEWVPFTEESPSTLILDLPAENQVRYRQDRMKFWWKLKLREVQFPGDGEF